MIRRILVGLGGTPFTPVAIRQAVALAAEHDTELTGVTLVNVHRAALVGCGPPESSVFVSTQIAQFSDVEARIDHAVEEFNDVAEAAGVTRRSIVRETGEPFAKLIDLARYHDVVVCGLKKLLKYEFADGDPLDILVRFMTSGVQPVLSVGEADRTIRRALVAYSGSAESTRAMKRFVQFRLFPDAQIRVMTFGSGETARRAAESAAEFCRIHGFDADARTSPANAKTALLTEADDFGSDVIVLGSSARKTFVRRMLGDTALHVIKNSQVPLFLCQ